MSVPSLHRESTDSLICTCACRISSYTFDITVDIASRLSVASVSVSVICILLSKG